MIPLVGCSRPFRADDGEGVCRKGEPCVMVRSHNIGCDGLGLRVGRCTAQRGDGGMRIDIAEGREVDVGTNCYGQQAGYFDDDVTRMAVGNTAVADAATDILAIILRGECAAEIVVAAIGAEQFLHVITRGKADAGAVEIDHVGVPIGVSFATEQGSIAGHSDDIGIAFDVCQIKGFAECTLHAVSPSTGMGGVFAQIDVRT